MVSVARRKLKKIDPRKACGALVDVMVAGICRRKLLELFDFHMHVVFWDFVEGMGNEGRMEINALQINSLGKFTIAMERVFNEESL